MVISIWDNQYSHHSLSYFQNLLIEKVCLVNLGFDPDICSNLTNHKDSEIAVQKEVASLNMYLSVLTAIPGIIVSLFLGPWSDVNGRKPLIIFPQIGTMLTQFIYILNTLNYLIVKWFQLWYQCINDEWK